MHRLTEGISLLLIWAGGSEMLLILQHCLPLSCVCVQQFWPGDHTFTSHLHKCGFFCSWGLSLRCLVCFGLHRGQASPQLIHNPLCEFANLVHLQRTQQHRPTLESWHEVRRVYAAMSSNADRKCRALLTECLCCCCQFCRHGFQQSVCSGQRS